MKATGATIPLPQWHGHTAPAGCKRYCVFFWNRSRRSKLRAAKPSAPTRLTIATSEECTETKPRSLTPMPSHHQSTIRCTNRCRQQTPRVRRRVEPSRNTSGVPQGPSLVPCKATPQAVPAFAFWAGCTVGYSFHSHEADFSLMIQAAGEPRAASGTAEM